MSQDECFISLRSKSALYKRLLKLIEVNRKEHLYIKYECGKKERLRVQLGFKVALTWKVITKPWSLE